MATIADYFRGKFYVSVRAIFLSRMRTTNITAAHSLISVFRMMRDHRGHEPRISCVTEWAEPMSTGCSILSASFSPIFLSKHSHILKPID